MQNISDFIHRHAQNTPNKIAFVDAYSGREFSYLDFDKYAAKTAALFINYGIKPKDRIAILCRNRVEYFICLFACAKIGAILIPLNWRSPANELLPLIAKSTPSLIIHGDEDKECAKSLKGDSKILSLDDDFYSAIDDYKPYYGRKNWPVNDIWFLLYTSGTTGEPKAVEQTYGMALANYVNISQAIDMREDDVFLCFLPLFHTAGNNLHTIPALIRGCKNYVINGFDVEKMIELIDGGLITAIFGVPAIYLQISSHKDFDRIDFSKMRSMGCGGAPLPDALVQTYAAKGILICNGMGMTETGPTVFMMDKDNVTGKIGSIGKPQIMTDVIIVDNDYNEIPHGETGQIMFSGANITPRYWGNDAATNAAFHIDEFGKKWLKSGDLARIDKDGYYFIVGRAKEMFISGGENVYPIEVENILTLHPKIREVAVIGVKDEKWGEVGNAYIIPEGDIPSDDELIKYCRANLAPYKIPKKFITVKDFPRTAAGKIQKHLIGKA